MFMNFRRAAISAFGAALVTAQPVVAQPAAQIDMVTAMPPVAAYLPVLIGHEKGFYKEVGINLTIDPNIVGAQLIPAVLSGKVQVVGLIWPLLAIGASQGLPLKAVSALSSAGNTTETDDQQLIVLAKSSIKSGRDLVGKTVGVNTIRNVSEVLVRNLVEKDGGDPWAVKFTPILFPNMLAALRAESVDAVTLNEPFLTLAKQQENVRVVSGVFVPLQPFAVSGNMIMTNDFIAKNPDAVARFQRATIKAVQYCADPANEKELRAAVVKYTRVPAETAAKMQLPQFKTHHDLKDVKVQLDALVKFKLLEKNVDPATIDAQMKP